jgi:catechol 2,3-dioxygenase-like lactoylglutathione lyase family enzyme
MATAIPILFVRDVPAAAGFWRDRLGFTVDFVYGEPPFYAGVSRDGARLHLRHVDEPNFAELAEREDQLIAAMIEVADVKAFFAEFESRGVDFTLWLVTQPWGGTEFHVRDPDGNCVSFVTFQGEGT